MIRSLALTLLLAVATAACSSPGPASTPTTASPSPTGAVALDLLDPPNSEEIALTGEDFPHPVEIMVSQSLSSVADLTTFASSLAMIPEVTQYFDNGYKTWHMSPLNGDEPQLGASGWVLSFKTLEGAEKAFLLLAQPKRASILPEALQRITGERELPLLTGNDASRVFDQEIRYPLNEDTTTYHRALFRKGRVVVMVTGSYPVNPEYFTNLIIRMLRRVPESVPRPDSSS